VTTVAPGTSTTYTVVVTNTGPLAVTGATVFDNLTTNLTGVATLTGWTVVYAGGATGSYGAGLQTGNINDTVNFLSGAGTATYSITVAFLGAASGSFTNTATITAPSGMVLLDGTGTVVSSLSAADTDTLAAQADIEVTKTITQVNGTAATGSTRIVPGQTVTYQVVYSNNGPSTVTTLATDNFTSGNRYSEVTWTAVGTGSASGFSNDTDVAVADLSQNITLASGESVTYTVTALVRADFAGSSLSNTATSTIGGGATDPTSGNNTSTVNRNVQRHVNLSVDKEFVTGTGLVNATSAPDGGTAQWTIVVTNTGPSNLIGGTVLDPISTLLTLGSVQVWLVDDPLPANWDVVTTANPSGRNITWSIDLAAGSTVTYYVSANVIAGSFDDGPLNNTATVNVASGTTNDSGTNSDSDSVPVVLSADLEVVSLTPSVSTVSAGDPITYDVVIQNNGTQTINGIILTPNFNVGYGLTGATWTITSGGSGTGAGLLPATINLAAGASMTIQISGTMNAGALPGTSQLIVTAVPPTNVTDPDLGNNSEFADVEVIRQAKLTVTKTDGQTTAVPGQSTTYTITVNNTGPLAVNGATIFDNLTTALNGTAVLVSWTVDYTNATGNFADLFTHTFTGDPSDNINDVVNFAATNGSVTYTVVVNILPTARGSLANTVTVAAPAGMVLLDSGGAVVPSISATDTETLTPRADVAVTKSVTRINGSSGITSTTPLVPGQTVTYQVTYTNSGPSTVSVQAFDDLTTGGRYSSVLWTAAGSGSASGFADDFNPAVTDLNQALSLAAGSSVTYTITAMVAANYSGSTLANTATATIEVGATDTNTGNNSDTETRDIERRVSLTVDKEFVDSALQNVTQVVSGTTAYWTITVSNSGPSDLLGATLSDSISTLMNLGSVTLQQVINPGDPLTWVNVGFATAGRTVSWSSDIAVGSTVTYLLSATVAPDAYVSSSSLTNTAQIGVPAGTVNTGATQDSDTVNLIRQVSYTLTKQDDVTGAAAPGDTIHYTMTVNNAGPSTAHAIVVDSFSGAGLTNVTWTREIRDINGVLQGSVTNGSGPLLNETLTLGPGFTVTYTVTARILSSFSGSSLTNTLSVVDADDFTSRSVQETTTVQPRYDLAVTKSVQAAAEGNFGIDPGEAVPGEQVTFRILVTNVNPLDPSDALDVSIVDLLNDPAFTNYRLIAVNRPNVLGAQASSDNYNFVPGGGLTISTLSDTADIPWGTTIEYVITADVVATARGTATNTATATPSNSLADPDTSNNSSQVTLTLVPQVDVSVTKSDGITEVHPGQFVTYTIRVENRGPSAANGLQVLDQLPLAGLDLSGGINLVQSAGSAAEVSRNINTSNGQVTLVLDLPAGTVGSPAFVEYQLTVQVTQEVAAFTALTDFTNTVTITPNEAETRATNPTTNNTSTDTDTPRLTVNVGVFKNANHNTTNNPVIPGQLTGPGNGLVTFTITVTNSDYVIGSTPVSVDFAAGVTVSDLFSALAAQLDNVRITAITTSGAQTSSALLAGHNFGSGPLALAGDLTDTLNLARNGFVTYTIVAEVPADVTAQTFTNTATVTLDPRNDDIITGNDSSSVSVRVEPHVSVVIAKTDTPAATEAVPGQSITYTITVSNSGPSWLTGAQVFDALPVAGVTPLLTGVTVASSFSGAGSLTQNQVGFYGIDDTVNLAPGSVLTYTVTGTILADAHERVGQLINQAEVTPQSTTVVDSGVLISEDADFLRPTVNLTVTKTDGVTEVTPGLVGIAGAAPYTYTITVNNSGPSKVTGVTVTDLFPVGYFPTTTGATLGTGSLVQQPGGRWQLQDSITLDPGTTVTYVIPYFVEADAHYTSTGTLVTTKVNTASVNLASITNLGRVPTVIGNTAASDTNTLTPIVDLAVVKIDNPTSAASPDLSSSVPGQQIVYWVTVSNSGPSDIRGAVVQDSLADLLDSFTSGLNLVNGVTWTVSATTAGEDPIHAGQFDAPTTTANFGTGNINEAIDLPSGSSVVYRIVGTIDPSARGDVNRQIVNTATVATSTGVTDSDPDNNSDDDANTLTPNVSVAIANSNGASEVIAGTTITYLVPITNSGPSTAHDVALSFQAPADFTIQTWQILDGNGAVIASGAGNPGTQTLTILPGEIYRLRVTGFLAANAGEPVANVPVTSFTATGRYLVDAFTTDSGGATSVVPVSASDTDPLRIHNDVQVTVDNSQTIYSPGNRVIYTIVVTNSGPSDARRVDIDAALPPGSFTTVGYQRNNEQPQQGNFPANESVDLLTGQSVTYRIEGIILASSQTLDYTASAEPRADSSDPLRITDPDSSNNSATDSDSLQFGAPGATGGFLFFIPPTTITVPTQFFQPTVNVSIQRVVPNLLIAVDQGLRAPLLGDTKAGVVKVYKVVDGEVTDVVAELSVQGAESVLASGGLNHLPPGEYRLTLVRGGQEVTLWEGILPFSGENVSSGLQRMLRGLSDPFQGMRETLDSESDTPTSETSALDLEENGLLALVGMNGSEHPWESWMDEDAAGALGGMLSGNRWDPDPWFVAFSPTEIALGAVPSFPTPQLPARQAAAPADPDDAAMEAALDPWWDLTALAPALAGVALGLALASPAQAQASSAKTQGSPSSNGRSTTPSKPRVKPEDIDRLMEEDSPLEDF